MPAQSNEASRPRKRKSPLRRLTRLITIAMVISALVQEMSKPAAERTWQGKVWRFVPYDFRMPTWERFRQSVWAPEDPHLFPDRVFGGRMELQCWPCVRPDEIDHSGCPRECVLNQAAQTHSISAHGWSSSSSQPRTGNSYSAITVCDACS
jgi:hypothetical protein